MKKIVLVLALVLGAGAITPAIVSASSANTETVIAGNRVTLFKKNGGTVIKKYTEYKVEDGIVSVLQSGKWFVAERSDMSGYAYMVNLGGRNNVWYFNL